MKKLFFAMLSCGFLMTSQAQNAERGITVCSALPLTGPAEKTARALNDGQMMMQTKINSEGGIGGKPLYIKTFDTGFSSNKTSEIIKSKISSGECAAWIGLFGVDSAMNSMDILKSTKTPVVGVYSGAMILRTPSGPFFNVRASHKEESSELAVQMNLLGIKRLAILHLDQGHIRGWTLGEQMIESAKNNNINISIFKEIKPGDPMEETVREIMESKSDAVLIHLPQSMAAKAMNLFKTKNNIRAFMYTSSESGNISDLIGDAANNTMSVQTVPVFFHQNKPIHFEFLSDWNKYGKGNPSYTSFEGYLNARILVEAIKKSGSSPTNLSIYNALENLDINLGGYHLYYTNGNRNGLKTKEITMTAQGKSVY